MHSTMSNSAGRPRVQVAEAWYQLVQQHHAINPDTAASVLETVKLYVNWIDIFLGDASRRGNVVTHCDTQLTIVFSSAALEVLTAPSSPSSPARSGAPSCAAVANERFAPLVLSLIHHGGTERCRAAACEVITEVVLKRMEAPAKVQLIRQLGIVPACAAWGTTQVSSSSPGSVSACFALRGGESPCLSLSLSLSPTFPSLALVNITSPPTQPLPIQDSESDMVRRVGHLLASLGSELLDAWKRVENSVTGLLAVGLDIDLDAAREAKKEAQGAVVLLGEVLPALLQAVRYPDDELIAPVVTFLQQYGEHARQPVEGPPREKRCPVRLCVSRCAFRAPAW